MSDKPFKQLERACAALISGARYPANQGGDIDVESETFAGQCKLLQNMPLAELSRQVVQIETAAKGKGKTGVLFVKHRAGRGVETPLLVVMSEKSWRALKCSCTPSSSSVS